MTTRSELVAALQALPADTPVRVRIGDRDGEITIAELLSLAPSALTRKRVIEAVNVRAAPGVSADKVGALQKGWAVDVLPGEADGFVRIVCYVKREYVG